MIKESCRLMGILSRGGRGRGIAGWFNHEPGAIAGRPTLSLTRNQGEVEMTRSTGKMRGTRSLDLLDHLVWRRPRKDPRPIVQSLTPCQGIKQVATATKYGPFSDLT